LIQGTGSPVAKLSRTDTSCSLLVRTVWWQFMHVCVGGIAATAAFSTVL
jgi:hypothetical protein